MRLLDEKEQDSIYKEIVEKYEKSGLPFDFHIQTIRFFYLFFYTYTIILKLYIYIYICVCKMYVCSGDEEGIYAWTAVQYLSHTLPIDIHTRYIHSYSSIPLIHTPTHNCIPYPLLLMTYISFIHLLIHSSPPSHSFILLFFLIH